MGGEGGKPAFNCDAPLIEQNSNLFDKSNL